MQDAPFLEDTLPPLTAAWICSNPPEDTGELIRVIAHLDRYIITLPCHSPLYLRDIVFLTCRFRHLYSSLVQAHRDEFVMPLHNNFHPDVGGDDDKYLFDLAATFVARGGSDELTALYRYALAHKEAATNITTAPVPHDAEVRESLLNTIVTNFCPDCKFKKTNDLFIWSIINLRCPPWICAGLAAYQSPFHICGKVHTEAANGIVQPLVKHSVESQLDKLAGTEKFCVVACIVLELMGISSKSRQLLVNAAITTANPDVPTLAVASSSFAVGGKTNAFGYLHRGTFFTSDSIFVALQEWLAVYEPSSHLYKILTADSVLIDNPFSKFC